MQSNKILLFVRIALLLGKAFKKGGLVSYFRKK